MLNKRYRLTKRGSFNYVYKKGAALSRGPLKLTYVISRGAPKIGISVPNSVGKAVVRNKVRRRIRAAVAEFIKQIKSAQIVISARSGAELMSYAQIREYLKELFVKSNLYEKKDDAVAGN